MDSKKILDRETSYYDILGVSQDADEKEIKGAYRKLALKYHPDRMRNKDEDSKREAEKVFAKITLAYNTLSNESTRKFYNDTRDNPMGEVLRQIEDAKIKYGRVYNKNSGAYERVRNMEDTPKVATPPVSVTLNLTPIESLTGVETEITVKGVATLNVNIPPYTKSGQLIMLKNEGLPPLTEGADRGDLLIIVNVNDGKLSYVEGDNLIVHKKRLKPNSEIALGTLVVTIPDEVKDEYVFKGMGFKNSVTGKFGDLILRQR